MFAAAGSPNRQQPLTEWLLRLRLLLSCLSAARCHIKLPWDLDSGEPQVALAALRGTSVAAATIESLSREDAVPPFPLGALAGHAALLDLSIEYCYTPAPGNWAALWRLTQLQRLRLEGLPISFLRCLAGMSQLTRLQQLRLCWEPEDGEPLPVAELPLLPALTSLEIHEVLLLGSWRHLRPLHQQLRRLELRSGGLAEVPEEVSCLTGCSVLDLSGNLPMDRDGAWHRLRPLQQLRELYLGNNGLEEVPQALSCLTGLTLLDLSVQIRVEGGWYHLGGWQHLRPLRQQLRSLNLAQCSLEAVPEELSCLMALTCLLLSYNHTPLLQQHGWQHLRPLQQLQHLQVTRCGLAEVPEALSALTALTCLRLSCNELRGGWRHLQPLQLLQILELRDCQLSKVPEALSALVALTCLDISGNAPAEDGWHHLRLLPQLRAIKLRCAAVPQALSALTALTCLSLSGSSRFPDVLLEGGCDHLRPLQQLQSLDLGYNAVAEVPEALSTLTRLTILSLRGNPLQGGGLQHLQPLLRLRALDLGSTRLTSVPPALAALTALVRLSMDRNPIRDGWQHLLSMDGNPIRDGWQHLQRLHNLEVLDAGGCGLTEAPPVLSALSVHVRLLPQDITTILKVQGDWDHTYYEMIYSHS